MKNMGWVLCPGYTYANNEYCDCDQVQDIIKDILFIPHTKSILELIPEFQKANYSLAIVRDEHGKTAGLITAQNILEELFGNFKDEFAGFKYCISAAFNQTISLRSLFAKIL